MKQTYILNANDKNRQTVESNLLAFVKRLPFDKSWRVDIEREVKKRTDPQNHALFGVAYPILSDQTGFTKDELHEAFCKRFFGTVEREFAGQVSSKPFRTTTKNEHGKRDVIDAVTFAEFYKAVQQVGTESGIDVPDPDKFWRERLKNAA